MKPIVVFAAAFAVAMGASTGAKVVMTKPGSAVVHKTGPDSTLADSLKSKGGDSTAAAGEGTTAASDSVKPDSVKKDSVKKDSTIKPIALKIPTPGQVMQAGKPAGQETAASTPAKAPATAATAPASTDTSVQASERRIAKVFTSMDAKKAAEVLGHMADADVQIILGYVGPRQAASILAALPPERVAVLSKRAMQGKPQ